MVKLEDYQMDLQKVLIILFEKIHKNANRYANF